MKAAEIQNLAGSYSSARRRQLVISLLLFCGSSLFTCHCLQPQMLRSCDVLPSAVSAVLLQMEQPQCQLSSKGLAGSIAWRA